MTNVVVSHAYSRRNAGDGLLVDESLSLLSEVFPEATFRLLAHDAASFADWGSKVLNPLSGSQRDPTKLHLIRAAVLQRPAAPAQAWLERADLVVAVGGGYLRGGSLIEYLKAYVAHRSQTPRVSCPPVVYLPQSIGPLPCRGVPLVERLKNAAFVAVRDDRSLGELEARGVHCIRMPDLVALAVERSIGLRNNQQLAGVSGPAEFDRFALVARALKARPRSYIDNIRKIAQFNGCELRVQSRGRGNNDPKFYSEMGFQGPYADLQSSLSSENYYAVVSVRLHGSLQAILAGVPSIHLSYERKGFGAYEDLGLQEWVHNARDFDPATVRAQLAELRDHPGRFWDSLTMALPTLRQQRANLMSALRELI